MSNLAAFLTARPRVAKAPPPPNGDSMKNAMRIAAAAVAAGVAALAIPASAAQTTPPSAASLVSRIVQGQTLHVGHSGLAIGNTYLAVPLAATAGRLRACETDEARDVTNGLLPTLEWVSPATAKACAGLDATGRLRAYWFARAMEIVLGTYRGT